MAVKMKREEWKKVVKCMKRRICKHHTFQVNVLDEEITRDVAN